MGLASGRTQGQDGVIWNMIPHCLMWGVLGDRNARIFEGTESSTQDLKLAFLCTLLGWTMAFCVFTFNSLPALLNSCTFHAPQFCLFSCVPQHTSCVLWFFVVDYFLSMKFYYLKKKKKPQGSGWDAFLMFSSFSVGDGTCIKFWHDSLGLEDNC